MLDEKLLSKGGVWPTNKMELKHLGDQIDDDVDDGDHDSCDDINLHN